MKVQEFLTARLLPFLLGVVFGIFFLLYILNGLDFETWTLVVLLVLACVGLGFFAVWLAKKQTKQGWAFRKKSYRPFTLIAFSIFVGLLLFGNIFPHPLFAREHHLKICVFYPDNTDPIVIRQIRDEFDAPIPLAQVKGEQPWNLNGAELVAQASGACAEFNRFFSGNIAVYFKTSPNQGEAEITWDGETTRVTLDSLSVDTLKVELSGASAGSNSFRGNLAILGQVSRIVVFAAVSLLASAWITAARDLSLTEGATGRALAVLTMFNLAALSQLGKSVAMVADDFCFAAASVGRGVYEGALVIYTTVNGRLAPAFLDSLSGSLFSRDLFPWAIWLVLLTWILVLEEVVWLVGKTFSSKFSRLNALLLSGLSIVAVLSTTPSVAQSLYWHSGRTPLVDPILLFLVEILLVAAALKSLRPGLFLVLTFFVSLLAGMFHEAFAASQFALWAVLLVFLLLSRRGLPQQIRKRAITIGLIAIVGALLGLLTNVLSPGTAERSATLGTTFSLGNLIYGTLTDTGWFFTYKTITALSLALFGFAYLVGSEHKTVGKKERERLTRIWKALPLGLLIVLASSFAVSRFGLGGILPERTQIVPVFWSILFTLVWGLLTGALFSKPWRRGKSFAYAETAIFFVLFAALVYQVQWANSYRETLDRYAVSVSRLWNEVDKAQAADASRAVVTNFEPNPFGLADPGIEDSTFVNGCIERLAGVRVEFVGQ